jgi:superoxide dismutase, Fe-Mn family
MKYEAKTFVIPDIEGISKATMDNHLGLYQGYVKHVNVIEEQITTLSANVTTNAYLIGELQRRLGFEFCGMRNHEYYFSQFEGGAKTLGESRLKKLIEAQWGDFDTWLKGFTQIAKARGIGWAMLYYDKQTNQLVQTWVDEQHIGQLVDVDIILALDMWEHSYLMDYASPDKGKYIDAFFKNINWEVVANRLS